MASERHSSTSHFSIQPSSEAAEVRLLKTCFGSFLYCLKYSGVGCHVSKAVGGL